MYLIVSKNKAPIKSYVGYTNNIKKRIYEHNRGRGAKSTRGRSWVLAFKRKFRSKTLAMKYEYFLKKNKKLRKKIKNNYVI